MVSATHNLVPDLEADNPQHQEGRQEGVKQQEVLRVSIQGAGVALVDDLAAVHHHAHSRQFPSGIAREVKIVELGDDQEFTAVLLEGQVTESLEDGRHLLGASEEAGSHQDPGNVEQSHSGVHHVGVLDHPQ